MLEEQKRGGILIKVIGYYNHCNLGDEQYKLVISDIISNINNTLKVNHTLQFIDCDTIINHAFDEHDFIVLGGGDVLNDYFLDKVISVFGKRRNKIIALSVGLPFVSTLKDTNKLNIIDSIFLRTKQDMHLFQKYYNPHRIYYLPDLSYWLMKMVSNVGDNVNANVKDMSMALYTKRLNAVRNSGKQIVCLSLSRHIFDSTFPSGYKNIVTKLSHFVSRLAKKHFHIVFLPFNTNENNTCENDILIHRDVLSTCLRNSSVTMSDVTLIDNHVDALSCMRIFKLVDYVIPMRFHATLFAIYNNVPFLPIFTTRKVRNLLLDIDWQYGYELYVNAKFIPTDLDTNILWSRFSLLQRVCSTSRHLYEKLQKFNVSLIANTNFDKLTEILNDVQVNEWSSKTTTIVNKPLADKLLKIDQTYKAIEEYAQSKGYRTYRQVNDEGMRNIIVSIVSYNLTNGQINSKYTYGLKAKMFDLSKDYIWRDEWKWILEDIDKNTKIQVAQSNPLGMFNLTYIDQVDYSGVHRSGWQYVYDNLIPYHNENSNLLLDLYVDRTFHWNKEFSETINLIPYTKPWVGFIHHTFDTSFSDYNCYNLLGTESFLKSLDTCKALLVLSDDLKVKLKNELCKKGYETNVLSLVHPTETNVQRFTYENFLQNSDKKLIHVGGWLRNIYSFYALELPSNVCFSSTNKYSFSSIMHDSIRKVALKGINMSNYYPNDTFLDDLHNILVNKDGSDHGNECVSGCVSTNQPYVSTNNMFVSSNVCLDGNRLVNIPIITNNWYKDFYTSVIDMNKKVDFIYYLENTQYDDLLSKNIVFINLVDASAVNTLVECIVRNTPIFVNKHPAVVELLGSDYPLYYQSNLSNFEISNRVQLILRDPQSIKSATKYLKHLDKSKISITKFLDIFLNIIATVN